MKYYIIYPEKVVEFENYIQLINYLLTDTTPSWYTCKHRLMHETLKDRIKICKSDTYRKAEAVGKTFIRSIGVCIDHIEYRQVPRDIKIVDEFGKNAYTSELQEDLKKYHFRKDVDTEWKKYTHRNDIPHYSCWNLPPIKFREEPVPYVRHWHKYNWLRHPRTTQEIRQSSDPEYKEFVRKSRGKHLPTCWDDLLISSNSDISWKNCTKNRHQWENRVKCHSKHMYVVKLRDELDEEVEENYNDYS